jgi:hypothetical protein
VYGVPPDHRRARTTDVWICRSGTFQYVRKSHVFSLIAAGLVEVDRLDIDDGYGDFRIHQRVYALNGNVPVFDLDRYCIAVIEDNLR